jgi:hypothetical protein
MTYGQRVYRACREQAEVEYLRAIKREVIDPVILVDTRGQEERYQRLASQREMPEGFEMAHVLITIGTRSQIADEVGPLSRAAAKDILSGPHPKYPFTVVILGDRSAEVFDEEEPVPGEGM